VITGGWPGAALVVLVVVLEWVVDDEVVVVLVVATAVVLTGAVVGRVVGETSPGRAVVVRAATECLGDGVDGKPKVVGGS
jgi:hypothetical protein